LRFRANDLFPFFGAEDHLDPRARVGVRHWVVPPGLGLSFQSPQRWSAGLSSVVLRTWCALEGHAGSYIGFICSSGLERAKSVIGITLRVVTFESATIPASSELLYLNSVYAMVGINCRDCSDLRHPDGCV
jgi:hypothetical protein